MKILQNGFKNYFSIKIHDLDNCLISPRINETWLGYLQTAVNDLLKKYPDLKSEEIPDERLRELEDGSAQIFVRIRNSEIKLSIPKGEWQLK